MTPEQESTEHTDRDEQHWQAGFKAAFARIAGMCANELDGEQRGYQALLAERANTIAKLRELCDEVGDEGEWPDSLYMPDIIEKHILRHLLSPYESPTR